MSDPVQGIDPLRRQIWTRVDWDRAVQEGWLARDDVEARLYRLAVRDLGVSASAGYDEDGFFLALVADGKDVEGIGRFIVYSNDHDPPHVHVKPYGSDVDLKFSLETGDLLGEQPRGVTSKQVKNMRAALREIHAELGAWWEKAQGEPVAPLDA